MKFKLKNGSEVDLHEDDIKAISQMHETSFNADEMIKYFEDVHKHASQGRTPLTGTSTTTRSYNPNVPVATA